MIDKFAHIRELCEKATSGPWVVTNDYFHDTVGIDSKLGEYPPLAEHQKKYKQQRQLDCTFAAEARTTVPELLDALDKARVALEFYRHQGNYLYDAPVEGDGLSDKGERARQCYEDIWGTE